MASITPPWHTMTIVEPARSPTRFDSARTDAQVELGGGLAARKQLGVRVAAPVRRSEPLDVRLEAHAVEVGARVVLTERGVDLQGRRAERFEEHASAVSRARAKLLAMTTSARDLPRLAESSGEPTRLVDAER